MISGDADNEEEKGYRRGAHQACALIWTGLWGGRFTVEDLVKLTKILHDMRHSEKSIPLLLNQAMARLEEFKAKTKRG